MQRGLSPLAMIGAVVPRTSCLLCHSLQTPVRLGWICESDARAKTAFGLLADPPAITAYEKKIADLEIRRLLIAEMLEN